MLAKVTNMHTKLLPQQEDAAQQLAALGCGALIAPTRSGKTLTLVRACEIARVDSVMVVCPKIAVPLWQDVLAVEMPGVLGLVVNYESLLSKGFPEKFDRFRKAAGGDMALICDESHRLKTPASKTRRALLPRLKYFSRRFIATATPVSNASKIDEIYSQYSLLGGRITSMFPTAKSWREHFGVWQHYPYPKLLSTRYEDEMHRLVSDVTVTLPERFNVREPVKVPCVLPENIQEIHDAIAVHGIYEGLDETYAPNPLVKLLKCRQQLHCVERMQKLDSCLPDNTPVLVFCEFRREVEEVAALLAACGRFVGVVTGATKDKHRVLQQVLDRAGVVVCVPSTISTAIELKDFQLIVWYSRGFNYLTWSQACDRVKANPNAQVLYLEAENTVDVDVSQVLGGDHAHLENLKAGLAGVCTADPIQASVTPTCGGYTYQIKVG